jgi:hypothetical protein
MPKLTRYLFFFVLFVMASFTGYSQYDTVRPGSYFKNDLISYHRDDDKRSGWNEIDRRAFPIASWKTDVNILQSLFYVREMSKGWNAHTNTLAIGSTLRLQHFTFYPVLGSRPSDERYAGARYAIANNLYIDSLLMPTETNAVFRHLISRPILELVRSKLDGFTAAGCEGGLSFSNNDLVWASLEGGRYDRYVDFRYNRFLATNPFFSSELNHYASPILFAGNEYDSLTMSFDTDSIGSEMQINNYRNDYHPNILHDRFFLTLAKCYINGPMNVIKNGKLSIIEFDHCSFGPDAADLNLMADTVEFRDCGKLPATLALHLLRNKDTCWLKLRNTRFDDVNFVYEPFVHLAFDSIGVDEYTSKYESLLAKFRIEKKDESYERLDLEYQGFKGAHNGYGAHVFNWLNREWWNYGYSRGKVIQWTFLFLGLFFVGNVLLWKPMQETYAIEQSSNFIDRQKHPVRYQVQKYIRIFLYTAYIFFSIKIDLPRLKITSFWLLLYFFFQFLVGLWCLFFIVNALLKIG